jgi:caffeoyl-CoA O-methyltransferase
MDSQPHQIEAYAQAHSSPEDPLLAELARVTHERSNRARMLTGHIEGALLRMLVQALGARRVLELGTFTGYSALSMAMGLPDNGRVITCDIDPETTQIARDFWARSVHGAKIELRLGPAPETIRSLDGPLDFVFIDADKANYIAYWDAVLPKVRPGGLIAADNVLWSGRVLDPKEPDDHAIVAFNRHVRHDDRVELVMLTVRDGITLARKR